MCIEIFDTAFYRAVPSDTDVFELVALRLIAAGFDVHPDHFKRIRVESEREAHRRVAGASTAGEIEISDIYAIVAEKAPPFDVSLALQCELEVERAVSVVNSDVMDLYDLLQTSAIPVVFAAYTYLPRAFISQLLEAAGYRGRHSIIVTAPIASATYSRQHLAMVARETQIDARAIIYLGANQKRFLKIARHVGFLAYAYCRKPKPSERYTWSETIGGKVLCRLESIARLNANDDTRMLSGLGFGLAGPLFLGLTQWLVRNVRASAGDFVLFCARDGYFVQVVYDILRRYEELPPSKYFEVSRRALAVPSILDLDASALNLLAGNKAAVPIEEYFRRIGIDLGEHSAKVAAAGLSAGRLVSSIQDRSRVVHLFKMLRSTILEKLATERPLVEAYLRQVGIFTASRVILFDIGYGGSLQKAVSDFIVMNRSSASLSAYYLSTDERILTLPTAAGPATAWFANAGQPPVLQSLVSPGYWLLEVFFGGMHGTVLGYRSNKDGRVMPIYQQYDSSTPNASAARLIQTASLELVERWVNIFNGSGPEIPLQEVLERYKRFVVRPTREEASFFGDLVHIGGLGDTQETHSIAKPPGLKETLLTPSLLVTRYQGAHWKLAYLQRLFHSNRAARAFLALRTLLRAATLRLRKLVR